MRTRDSRRALDAHGREALLKYVLRPPIAQERVVRGPDGLVRIALKRAFSDGTTAIDMTRFVIPEGGDPLSLLSRLAASVPAPVRGLHLPTERTDHVGLDHAGVEGFKGFRGRRGKS